MANGFTVSEFREALQGGSRPNLFKIRIPAVPTAVGDALQNGFEFVCRAGSLPASTIGLIEVPINAGRRLKMGGDRVFAEWSSTILNDEGFAIRSNIELWQNRIVNSNFNSGGLVPAGSIGRQYTTNDLFSTVEIYQLDDDGNEVASNLSITLNSEKFTATKNLASAKLINCWPSDISTIELSYDSTDTVEEFTVTWVYDYCIYGDNSGIPATT